MERGGQFAVVVQFCLLALAWGASFLFIKIGLTALSPAQVVWSRLVFGALALVLVVIVRRTAVPCSVSSACGPWSITGQHDLLPQLACLGATTCYGLAFAYLRRFVSPRGVPAPTAAFVQVTVGAVLMLAATPFLAADPITPTWPVVLSMIALGRSARVWPTSGTPPSSARGARRTPRRSPT